MKVVLYMAQTINGLIARDDYGEDFLSNQNWKTFVELAEKIGCFIVGRKTYEEVKKWKDYKFDNINATKIVVSSKSNFNLDKGYLLANSPKDALRKASELGFKKVILTGGGKTNAIFMKEGLIDEMIINIEPFILGKGINIFSEGTFENKLRLINSKKLKSGIIQLNYRVIK